MSLPIEIPPVLLTKNWFIEKHCAELEEPFCTAVKKLILQSHYVCRHVNLLNEIIHSGTGMQSFARAVYFERVECLSLSLSPADFMKVLRQFRHEHFLRLMLLQALELMPTEKVLEAWSDCADAIILRALDYCKKNVSKRFGEPRTMQGARAELLTIAMGKLGGLELNFSSDIDLIFAFTECGNTDGEMAIDNQQYFSKVIQQLVFILQTVTSEGFVFRVDLRLRPNGESGPLVLSFTGMEIYYQEQGRDWERYAMVKARIIDQVLDKANPWFDKFITPFVYKKYVDFSVIESLRSMKAMIEREVRLDPRLDDIKRGQGGIREVEFIIQNIQLIRGGRLLQLQNQSALGALAVLKEQKLFPHPDVLKKAYLFLRQLENAIQSIDDQQVHALPVEPVKQQQVMIAMGFANWTDFLAKLHQYQRIISQAFRVVLGPVQAFEDEKRVLSNQLASLWKGHVEDSMAIHLLISLGYDNAAQCYQMIHAFRHSPRCRRLSQASRIRLDRFMVVLLTELTQFAKTDQVLLQMLRLLEQLVGRSAYLALLSENPQALNELLYWLENSPFITTLLVSQPFLLEALLDEDRQWRADSRRTLEKLLKEQLSQDEDIETREDRLRQFKLKYWLLAARAELYGDCDAIRVAQFLADLADVIVNEVFQLSFQHLSMRYPDMMHLKTRFAIVAYGKLGSREMSYHSDLDLVFLHNASSPREEALVTRLTQKILNMMTVRSQSGVLYAVDTRLRPSGVAGLLVSHVDAFTHYQKHNAWTWEHQALLKARVIVGTPAIKRQLIRLKKSILAHPKESMLLKSDVKAMREKIDEYHEKVFLKHAAGGLLDLEFLMQFLILSEGGTPFSRYTHTLSQMNHLEEAGILTKDEALILKGAYKTYHRLLHQHIVHPGKVQDEAKIEALQKQVATLCERRYSMNSAYKS